MFPLKRQPVSDLLPNYAELFIQWDILLNHDELNHEKRILQKNCFLKIQIRPKFPKSLFLSSGSSERSDRFSFDGFNTQSPAVLLSSCNQRLIKYLFTLIWQLKQHLTCRVFIIVIIIIMMSLGFMTHEITQFEHEAFSPHYCMFSSVGAGGFRMGAR